MEKNAKSLTMEGCTAFLPDDDIMVNILKRLPVESIIRFQCVCRHWKNLFKMPSFIADHFHHSSHQKPLLLIRWHFQRYNDFSLLMLDLDMQELMVHETQFQNGPLIDSFWRAHIVGSSNGLLCLKASNFILFWKPATREISQVPAPINNFKGIHYLGFGFSSVVNDYKVVIIYVIKEDEEVEFGDLKGLCISSRSVTVDGAMFWLMPVPDAMDMNYGEIKRLTVYDNNLAMLCSKWIRENEDELWVMEEATGTSGERWSWTHTYSSPFRGLVRLDPVAIWRNEIVCEAR
ncbi:F-box protein At3g07870-like [Prosopis cineraria]|uniref:F-box protein At3g07870-like n=1 Tax=Prosopis cineraria TaxID=364024 RepID=UPI00240EC651|nr:F-box protein At3g07870-like [Prosopis cineraria]